MKNFHGIQKIHFIGIGGIGVSGLAKIFLLQGKRVSGSDLTASKNTKDLKKLGAKIFIGPHKAKNVAKDLDLIIFTQAAENDNSELITAKKFGIRTLSYPQVLGHLTKEKFTICISGTHGKTTTTSLVSLILDKAGLDPTCIIGSNLKEFNGNARCGKSKYFILEADEYKNAFLNYWPKIAVLTAIEYEHPDYFKNVNHTIAVFKKYIARLPENGLLIANADDKNVMEVVKSAKCKVVTYGIKNKKVDFVATDIKLEGGHPEFKISNSKFLISNQIPNSKFQINPTQPPLILRGGAENKFPPLTIRGGLKTTKGELSTGNNIINYEKKNCPGEEGLQNFTLNIPGIHNVYNALAVVALASELKIDLKIVKKVLSDFRGAWRRFEYKMINKKKNITVIDDYAHHPTEIKTTLAAARQRFPKEKIICIFQPHQIKRTKVLFTGFTKAFSDADEVILTDIYAVAGRDIDPKEMNSEKLSQALVKKGVTAKYLENFGKIVNYIKKTAKKNRVIITMGAGDITKLSNMLVRELN